MRTNSFSWLFLVVAVAACGADTGDGSGGRTGGGGGSGGNGGSGASSGGHGGAGATGTGGNGGGSGVGGTGAAGSGGASGAGVGGNAGSGTGGTGGTAGSGGASGGGTGGSSGSAGAGATGGKSGAAGTTGTGGTAGTGGASGAAGASGGGAAGAPDAGRPTDGGIVDAPRIDVSGDACAGIGAANVELGTPIDSDPSDDVILNHTYYVVSYSPTKYDPNWVSWHLSASDIGSTARQDNFAVDPLIPSMYYAVKATDYQGSGYDRGHMSPSADNTASVMQNSESFIMSNMMPQTHELNAGPWELFESFERSLALTNRKEVYIVSGGIFDAAPTKIGPGVAVPKTCFKIIVALDAGQGPCDITLTTPIYAVIMPNTTAVSGTAWGDYATSIDAIEAATGYDFLPNVPLNMQTAIESRITKAPSD